MFVVVVWFCCLSWLAFLILAYLINLMPHLLLPWVICFGGYLFFYTPIFFEKYLIFWVFLSLPHLVDNYVKIVDERGRNLMCDCILPSRLVILYSHYSDETRTQVLWSHYQLSGLLHVRSNIVHFVLLKNCYIFADLLCLKLLCRFIFNECSIILFYIFKIEIFVYTLPWNRAH